MIWQFLFLFLLLLHFFCFFKFLGFLASLLWTSLLWSSLLCIMGELARGGSVPVAIGVSDKWQMTRNMWHMTYDILSFLAFLLFYTFMYILVLVLISASVKRVSVSHLRDFFYFGLRTLVWLETWVKKSLKKIHTWMKKKICIAFIFVIKGS